MKVPVRLAADPHGAMPSLIAAKRITRNQTSRRLRVSQKQHVLLLADVTLIPWSDFPSIYDPTLQLNVTVEGGQPFVLAANAVTHSKTHARPGDDDPDPRGDRCY